MAGKIPETPLKLLIYLEHFRIECMTTMHL